MKKIIYILISFFIATGCSKTNGLIFCEGVSSAGEGVNCGSKFSTGDLTVVVNSEKAFGSEKIDIDIFSISKNKEEKIDSTSIKVELNEKSGNTTLSFYNSGKYKVKAINKNETLAEGDIDIINE